MKNKISALAILVGLAASSVFIFPSKVKADFNPHSIISDEAFVNQWSMSEAEVQSFLTDRGSFLDGFVENNRSAASIIYAAAFNNSISPRVILATLQKEQSLITMKNQNDNSLRKAMGYGCPDSGSCDPNYAGFTQQVEYGTWQLKYNYNRSNNSAYSDYMVGQDMVFDGSAINLSNQATAALYRYTPHISGNQSFYNIFTSWFKTFEASLHGQGPYAEPGAPGYPLTSGKGSRLWVRMRNTGSSTWYRGQVNLGNANPVDRKSIFSLDPNNLRPAPLKEEKIIPGDIGTFEFDIYAPKNPGKYGESFQLVNEGVSWFGPVVKYELEVGKPAAEYHSQGPGTTDSKIHLAPGQKTTLWVKFTNNGKTTWNSWGNYPINLGTSKPNDRKSIFLTGNGQTRGGSVKEGEVPPGGIGTFEFEIIAPEKKGEYREYFQLVQEQIGWFGTQELHWDIIVE